MLLIRAQMQHWWHSRSPATILHAMHTFLLTVASICRINALNCPQASAGFENVSNITWNLYYTLKLHILRGNFHYEYIVSVLII